MSRRQHDYKIVALPTDLKEKLEEDVKELMKEGWEVLGAPFIDKRQGYNYIFQAMIKF